MILNPQTEKFPNPTSILKHFTVSLLNKNAIKFHKMQFKNFFKLFPAFHFKSVKSYWIGCAAGIDFQTGSCLTSEINFVSKMLQISGNIK